MLLGNCKAKIEKVSTAFAIALLSARLEQAVCYNLAVASSLHTGQTTIVTTNPYYSVAFKSKNNIVV
jgi:hypothetical protein